MRPTATTFLIALVLAGCAGTPPGSPAPTGEPPSAAPSLAAPTPTTAPTAVASPTPPPAPAFVEHAWTQVTLPSVANAAVRTDDGWVAIATGCGGGCDSFDEMGAFSPDGLIWTEKLMNDDAGGYLADVVLSEDRLFALASRTSLPGGDERSQAVVHESTDGTTWEAIATIDLGPCNADGCLIPYTLSASEDADFVLGATSRRNPTTRGIFTSVGGRSWTGVDAAAFGSDGPPFAIVRTIASHQGNLLAAACAGCPVSVWASDEGTGWEKVGTTAGGTPTHLEMAYDGTTLVIAQETCVAGEEDDVCTMTLWSGFLGGPLQQTGMDIQVVRPRLAAVTDGLFVLAGQTGDGPRVYAWTSATGWAEQPSNLDFQGCTIADLVAGPIDEPGELLMLGDADCGSQAWLGRVRI